MLLEGVVHGVGNGVVVVMNTQIPRATGDLLLGFANGSDTGRATGFEITVIGYPT